VNIERLRVDVTGGGFRGQPQDVGEQGSWNRLPVSMAKSSKL